MLLTKKIETKIQINAPAENVWKMLTNVEKYETWNSFLKISNLSTPGERFRLKTTLNDGSQMSFKPVLLQLGDGQMRWRGHFLMPGLFTGAHEMVIRQLSENTCKFTHNEYFTGALVPFISLKKTKEAFEKMNQDLKRFAENER